MILLQKKQTRPQEAKFKGCSTQKITKWLSSWWFQPIWKIWVKLGIFPRQGWKYQIVVPPNHPFLIGFSILNHPFWGTPIFGNTQMIVVFKERALARPRWPGFASTNIDRLSTSGSPYVFGSWKKRGRKLRHFFGCFTSWMHFGQLFLRISGVFMVFPYFCGARKKHRTLEISLPCVQPIKSGGLRCPQFFVGTRRSGSGCISAAWEVSG